MQSLHQSHSSGTLYLENAPCGSEAIVLVSFAADGLPGNEIAWAMFHLIPGFPAS